MSDGTSSSTTPIVLVVIGVGGMGAAIARRVGPAHAIVLADRDEELLAATEASMRDEGYRVSTSVVDVADRASVRAVVEKASSIGQIGGVVHTAGVSPMQASPARIIAVDLVGTAYVIDEFACAIGENGAGVVIASMAGTLLGAGLGEEAERLLATAPAEELSQIPAVSALLQSHGDDASARSMAYAIAKRANQLRVCEASIAWGERGARLNSISPGIISTPMGRSEIGDSDSGELMKGMIGSSPVKRIGTPADVAGVVEFLLGPCASYITGTDVLVDGGVVAAMKADRVAIGA